MFFNNIRFQLAALAFLLIIIVTFVRTRRMKTLQTRAFSALLVLTCVNLLFDIATVYTITHLETAPAWLNRLCHQCFIGSMDTLIYCLFVYAYAIGRGKLHMRRAAFSVMMIPYLISLVVVCIAPLYYYNDGVRAYSYGGMAVTVYATVGFYMVAINVVAVLWRGRIDLRTRFALHAGSMLWLFIALLQMMHPWVLLSGLGETLLVFHIFLSLENPREHTEEEAGCFNRHAFHAMLGEYISGKKPFYVVSLSLDNLNEINKRIGQAQSCTLLRSVAQAMQNAFQADIYHYRGGGFLVLTRAPEDVVQTACNALNTLFLHEWHTEDVYARVQAHLDILLCPQYAPTGDEVYGMLELLQDPPAPGQPRVRFVTEQTITRRKRRTEVRARVLENLKDASLTVSYQPIYDVAAQQFRSAEALVRMPVDSKLGYISPDEFVPIAEREGLITTLGLQVFDKVCAFAAKNRLWDTALQFIEVNLSGVQMADSLLADRLMEIMALYGVPPHFINFEITETATTIQAEDVLWQNMRALRAAGCNFSMDDFGTGYANLAQVVETSYDLIKLDKSLIWPCFGPTGEKPRVVLQSVVDMVSRLHTRLVAEGVETAEQAQVLAEMGVHYMQGYYYARPLTEAAFQDFLQEHTAPAAAGTVS